MRYNFLQAGARLVPYIQIRGRGSYNDIYRDRTQRRIGEGFEIVLHGGLGVRWMMNDRWGLSLQGDFTHVSNADLASRNLGLNSAGGTIGLNYFY